VITPGYNFYNNKFDYRNTEEKGKDNAFNYGTSGFVFGGVNRYDQSKSSAFSISVNQLANYNNHVSYSGMNNNSSWSEQYVEQLVADRASISDAENNYIFGSSLAFWTFLVDTLSDGQGNVLGYQSQVPLPSNPQGSTGGVMQSNTIDTKGGAHELAFAFGSNKADRLNFGVSLAIPFYTYKKDQTYREDDLSNNPNNYFSFFEYKEHYTTFGVGFNAKLGVIFRPIERLRLGLAFHTPTFGSFTDKIDASITTNTENYTVHAQPITKTSDELKLGTNAGTYDYGLTTPLRAILSGSWVMNSVKDVTKQRGFITADLEFVNYGGTRYTASDEANQDDASYYDELNDIIKKRYKGALNVRVGGEMKFKTLMGRLGFAYMSSPYKDDQLKGQRMLLSGGLGYRNRGYFIDLTYVHALIRDSQVPYYLADKPNYIADGRNSRGNVVLTFGIKI